MSRIDALKGFLSEDPGDSFSRYALAMEYVKAGQTELGIGEFETVIRNDPGYVAAYYQLAKAYERSGRIEDALDTYRKGIGAATDAGDEHSRSELTEALLLLETSDS